MRGVLIGVTLATLVVGAVVGLFYLTRARRPALVSLHLVLGAAATALALVALHGGLAPQGRTGAWAGALLGTATFGGLMARLLWRRKALAEGVLVAHVAVGVAGFFVVLSWLARVG